jgi:hypothetical protein
VAGSPFGSFASTGKKKGCLGFVDIGDLSFYSICRENSFEKIMLQKMPSKRILSGIAIQED